MDRGGHHKNALVTRRPALASDESRAREVPSPRSPVLRFPFAPFPEVLDMSVPHRDRDTLLPMEISQGSNRRRQRRHRSSEQTLDIDLPFSFAHIPQGVPHLLLLIRKRVVAFFSTKNYGASEARGGETCDAILCRRAKFEIRPLQDQQSSDESCAAYCSGDDCNPRSFQQANPASSIKNKAKITPSAEIVCCSSRDRTGSPHRFRRETPSGADQRYGRHADERYRGRYMAARLLIVAPPPKRFWRAGKLCDSG